MRIYFVRHGQTNYNLKNLCNDDISKDVYLTELGKKQAQDVGKKLKNEKIEVIFVSELKRTRQTAEIINKYHNALIKVDSRINDRKTGFEGKSYFDFLKAIESDLFNMKINNGESFQDEKKRVHSFLDDLVKLNCNYILIVAHEEILKIVNGYFNKLSDDGMWARSFKNGEILEVGV